jgi:PTS system galactitol-specific IIB component
MAIKKKYKIASVCGSGYATSGLISAKLKTTLAGKGIDADFTELKIMDLAMTARNFDLIISASKLNDIYGVPVIPGLSILTGIGFEDTVETIISQLTKGTE